MAVIVVRFGTLTVNSDRCSSIIEAWV